MKRTNRFMLLAGVSLAPLASLVLRVPGDSSASDANSAGMTLKELVDRWSVLPPKPVTP